MAEIHEFPVGRQVMHANRVATLSEFGDPQEEAIASLELLFQAAVKVREMPSEVLDSVMIARKYTGNRACEPDRFLDAVTFEIGKAQHWLRSYRNNKRLIKEER